MTLPPLRIVLALAALALTIAFHHAEANTLRIYPFGGNPPNDVSIPKSKLLEGPDGAFYGTAFNGGLYGQGFGDGYIFRTTADGFGGNIYSFTDGNDGDNPMGALAQGPGNEMYGTAQNGAYANGVIFTITPDGVFRVIHTFAKNPVLEGSYPTGGLALNAAKTLFYGTTEGGGVGSNGVVYSVTLSGSVKRLHSFSAMVGGKNTDGAQPTSGLILGGDGYLYGVTPSGGKYGKGVIYRITPAGAFAPLYYFPAVNSESENVDGATPMGELTKTAAGVFYGVANSGGPDGDGLIYKITTTPKFTYTRYYYFTGGSTGAFPIDMTLGPSGSLWGMTSGGSDAGGSFFGIYPNETVVDYSFTGGVDGEIPDSGLLLGSDANLYGTTNSGGSDEQGTLFEIVLNKTVIPPWDPAQGRFFGLLANRVGALSVSLKPGGAVTATLQTAKSKIAYSGNLTATGAFSQKVDGITVSIQLQLKDDAFIFVGTADTESVTLFRSAYDAGEPQSNAGKYTQAFSPDTTIGTRATPKGDGYGFLTVSTAGLVSMSGTLADGSAFTSQGLLLQGTNGHDSYQFFNDPNFTGSIVFDYGFGSYAEGVIDWADNAAQNKYFPAGFNSTIYEDATRYTVPAKGVRAIAITSGTIEFSGGGLTAPFYQAVTLSTANVMTPVGKNPHSVKITLDTATGTVTGSFIGPATPASTTFHGVLYQGPGYPAIFGGFLGPVSDGVKASGFVELAPDL